MKPANAARPTNKVRCTVARQSGETIDLAFRLGTELTWSVVSGIGPHGISPAAADLVDLALSVFVVEKQVSTRSTTNPIVGVELTIPVRDLRRWKNGGATLASELLSAMGLPRWTIRGVPSARRLMPPLHSLSTVGVEQIALFSGGLDSTTGAATLRGQRASTCLVSFYTRQLELQRALAKKLGFERPTQWRMNWTGSPGRGHSFRYRSFLFLSIAAAVARSWGVKRILQFENGILASAIPPAPSFSMTYHAHPKLHASAEALFASVLDTSFAIENPFFFKTKRECVALVPRALRGLLQETQTCWYLYANHVAGRKKSPHVPCGVCIPCLLRRTALPNETCAFDINRERIRNHAKLGRSFRSYYEFLGRVKRCRTDPEFYQVLPRGGRELVANHGVPLSELHRLFGTFAKEFFTAFP